ncbi:MAG: type II toxin-antitoxin system HicA family toxin [Candidatus Absconditabacteria bacterium]|nr:type II toxin-antitoxin system HicA family toxin [Candidatus Absconditabacteria bacterium]MDD3262220.1 type II toxin-antitoxin system HicA family toxin [Candidatus Absconditabacteria bacterium]
MPRLVPLKPEEIIKKLRKLGYEGPESGGRHLHMIKGPNIIPIPKHGGSEIGVGLISKIIKEVGISRNEWIEL